MTQNLPSLKDFGVEFLTKCIELFIAHPDFYIISKHALKREYFSDSEPHKFLLSVIDKFFEKYSVIPSVVELRTINNSNSDEVMRDKCDYILTEIQINVDSKFDIKYYQFYIDQLSEFIKSKVYEKTIKDSIPLLAEKKFGEIDIKFHDAVEEVDFDVVVKDFIGMIDESLTPESRKAIPTGWNLLDDVMKGGIASGELAFIMGEIGAGKSWLLSEIAKNASARGFNTLYISLENRKREVVLRFSSIIAKVPPDDVIKNADSVKKDVMSKINKDTLFIEEYPTGGLSVSELYGVIRRYQNKTKKKLNLLVLDYIDILNLSEYRGEEWQKLRVASELLRKLAFEMDLGVWTATHPNTEGVKEGKMMKYWHVSGGTNRFKVVDFVFAFNRKPDALPTDRPKLQFLKNRNGKNGVTYSMEFDLTKPSIDILNIVTHHDDEEHDLTPVELLRSLRKAKDETDSEKKLEEMFKGEK